MTTSARGEWWGKKNVVFLSRALRSPMFLKKNEKKNETTSVYRLTRTKKAPNSKAFTYKLRDNAIHSKGLIA